MDREPRATTMTRERCSRDDGRPYAATDTPQPGAGQPARTAREPGG